MIDRIWPLWQVRNGNIPPVVLDALKSIARTSPTVTITVAPVVALRETKTVFRRSSPRFVSDVRDAAIRNASSGP